MRAGNDANVVLPAEASAKPALFAAVSGLKEDRAFRRAEQHSQTRYPMERVEAIAKDRIFVVVSLR